ncbi:hypothetical protein NB952_001795, partial [Campylobacter coli]|nr:hypothetical protein [Campylobacter coli]
NSSNRVGSIRIGVTAMSVLAGTGLSKETSLLYTAGSGFSAFTVSEVNRLGMVGQVIDLGPNHSDFATGISAIINISAGSGNSTFGFSHINSALSMASFSNIYATQSGAVQFSVAMATSTTDVKFISTISTNGLSGLYNDGLKSGETRTENIGQEQTAGVTTLK